MGRIDAGQLLLGTLLVSGLGAGDAMAQAPTTVAAADYERAAKMLGDRTAPLVDHAVGGATWLDDGTLVYRERSNGIDRVLRLDLASGKPAPAFDAKALADAINLAAGGKGKPVQADKLPPMQVSLDANGSLRLAGMQGDFRCGKDGCTAINKPASGAEPGAASPDGKREAFIRDWNLWLRDLASGKQKRQVTSGDWNVTRVAHIDQAARTIWFSGVGREAGRDPYFVHYYKAGLDGGEVQLLTPENATHDITVSKDGKHFVDAYSTTTAPPVVLLRDADGKQLAELARTDISRLKAAGWVAPEDFTVKARDGRTDLYGLMFKPSNFDAKKKYPIVTYIYPGPQVGSVGRRGFAPARSDHQALAELGFIVIAVDGMGTPLRSKSFQDAWYGDMVDNTLPDQVAALKQLAARHPWIDATRTGMWGHSGGGNATVAAMFGYPDVYKVGIAESGNHDNLSYEDDWGERYHGLLEQKADGSTNYTGQDNAPKASNLKGKLFLLHGLMDDNVPPQSTLLVVDALVKANKDFDLLLLPHARHGFGKDSFYVMRRRWDYFVKHLLGAEPPAQFELKPAM